MSGEFIGADVLRKIPIFGRMNDTERRQLAEIGATVAYAPGDVILRQGGSSQNLWVVLDGNCEVVKDPDAHQPRAKEVRLAVLEPFSNFGEMSFFHPAPHSASVRALSAVKLLRIERADYEELVEEGASAAYKLSCNAIDSLAERLRRMDEWVAELLPAAAHGAEAASDGVVSERVPEWSRFRDKLFTGWNL
jgi:CRP-like cAMP-binding protein